MATLWDKFQDDIKVLECSECGSLSFLHDMCGDVVCYDCLITLEHDEQEIGLTNEERNK